MKKLFIPTLAITALLLGAGCDMNKKTANRGVMNDDSALTLSTDDVRTTAAAPSGYGVSAGSAAAGNEHFKRTAPHRVARPVVTETDEVLIIEEPDYAEIDRQAMEEANFRSYPIEEFESEEARLNRLQKENSIFYGYPSATGASGAPGSAELNK